MKWENHLMKGCAGLFLFCILCLIIYLIYTAPAQRSASISLIDLAARSEVFPPGWKIKSGDDWVSIPEKGLIDFGFPREAGYRVFVFSNNENLRAFHWLFRYQNQWQANAAFSTTLSRIFLEKSDQKLLQVIDRKKSRANQLRFGCTDMMSFSSTKQTRCIVMARYDELITVFDAPLLLGVMGVDDIKEIFWAIDEQISDNLNQ
jgi:hypothetical protein